VHEPLLPRVEPVEAVLGADPDVSGAVFVDEVDVVVGVAAAQVGLVVMKLSPAGL
jgi:hypothetical protein